MTHSQTSERPTGYEPLGVLKPVAKGLWVIDGPVEGAGLVLLPTRTVVVQLVCGGLWVQAPGILNGDLMGVLRALGPLRHLVAPNLTPLPHLPLWQAEFPDAKLWAPEGSPLTGATPLCAEAPPDWATDMEQILIDAGPRYREAVFHYKGASALIAGDLIHAIETGKLPVWQRPFIWFRGVDDTDPAMPRKLRNACRDDAALASAVERMVELRPRRLLISHGRLYEAGGVAVLERSFRKLLRERQWTHALKDMDAKVRR